MKSDVVIKLLKISSSGFIMANYTRSSFITWQIKMPCERENAHLEKCIFLSTFKVTFAVNEHLKEINIYYRIIFLY